MNDHKCCISTLSERLSGKAESRCQKIVDVAYRLFLDNGYEKVSMNDIVKEAGGSLATLYKHFGNKEQLLIYILEEKSEELFGEWGRRSHCYEGRLEEFLAEIGKLFFDVICTEDAVLFHRLIISIGYLDETKLQKETILNLMMRPVFIIAEYLENEKKSGRIDVENTALCAQQFLNALKDPFIFPRIMGVTIDISEETYLKASKQVVTIFCKGLLRNQ
ncbi:MULTISPECIES: TetR/AcrR family transcriptional regulator [unclassified Sulfurospirillum]|uniref:TetR/AcrR family transcriptional regulator n=1 Tax=unclassified Sulfurospirillum TaxID=2618290 RepID=UPI0004FF6AD4|nr:MULTISPECIES: TetR/AcrR family transcriptional regulator [unclassified Sulfurospirillum]KFL35383.1 TetR family transcriptional regulator [Sulfurospirillum sp. SCADC]